MDYIFAHAAAEKWGITPQRAAALCRQNRIPAAKRVDGKWMVPAEAEKPREIRKGKPEPGREQPALRPFLKWAGGKGQLLGEIRRAYPQGLGSAITRYAEPFVGGGAVLFDLLAQHAMEEVFICDSNQALINVYRAIRDGAQPLMDLLDALQREFLALEKEERKSYYYARRKEFNAYPPQRGEKPDLRQAALFIFLNRTCFNGLYRVNQKGEFNVPMGEYRNPKIYDPQTIQAVSCALRQVNVVCGDYRSSADFIDARTFVYFDPPYRPLSTTARFTAYTQDCFDDDAQRRLAEYIGFLTEQKHARVLASNSDPKNVDPTDSFFDDLYAKYQISRVEAARLINRNPHARGEIRELLISNYEREE